MSRELQPGIRLFLSLIFTLSEETERFDMNYHVFYITQPTKSSFNIRVTEILIIKYYYYSIDFSVLSISTDLKGAVQVFKEPSIRSSNGLFHV